jgi:glycosyltransferase involved in cell wall biosynthesis
MINPVFATVIIPVHNDRKRFERCLAALCEQTYPRDKFEIVIIDDGSTDGLEGAVRSYLDGAGLDIKYFYQENKGPAAARNLGIKHSRGDILAFIDSDCLPRENWLEEILKGYDFDKTAGVGGVIEARPTDSKVSRYCAYVKMNHNPKTDAGGIVYLITGNASFRRDCLIAAGGFDEHFDFPGGEDPELCYRLKQKGHIFQFNHNAIVYNSHKQSLTDLWRTYFNYGRGEAFLAFKKILESDPIPGTGLKRWFYFFVTMIKILLMSMSSLKTLLRFIKIPLYALYYYGKGLDIGDSLRYAVYDYPRCLAFALGWRAGYLTGRFGGLEEK